MKRFIVVLVLLVSVVTLMADANKGKRYYMKTFKQKFKMNGLDFVQLHTQAEWKVLFDHQGRGFIIAFSQKFPKQKKFLEDPKLWKKLEHVRDFAIKYAKDSGLTPTCATDTEPLELEVQESSKATFF